MTETVLVIGGTGELGAPVARQPRGEGYRVRLLVRTPTGTRNRDADLEYVEGDLDDTGVGRLTYVSHMVSRALARPESAGTRVVTRPLWFMTVLDRTVLRGQLRGTLELMRALQHSGERRDRQRMGKPTTSGNRSSADPRGRVCSRWRP